jgi:CzcA family heavy metal efflux pump
VRATLQPPAVEERHSFWFTHHSKSVIFLIIALSIVGGYLAFKIPVAVLPEIDFPRIIIGVDNGVMPIDQMVVTVTRPIEEAVNSVPGLISVRSITSRGSAEVDLSFNWNVDMVMTLQQVNSALIHIQSVLPSTAQVDTHRLTFASFPILGYSLTSDTMPQTRLWELATYELKPRLNRLNGVATVIVQGGQEPEYQISPDPAKLLRASTTVTDMLDAIRKTNIIESPGLLERNHQLVLGLVNGQVKSPEEIGQIVVKSTATGIPVRIGDVATVTPSVKPIYTIVSANGKPAVLLNINRQPDSNTLEVANEVHATVDDLRKTLPPGVQLQPFYDQSTIVGDSIKSVRDAIFLGLILASAVLILFLQDWGTSVVAGLVIPVTVLITFIVLKLIGQSFNLMTLGGLAAAVGLVIDDAIVVVENIVLHRDAGEDRLNAIYKALKEITVPLVGSTLTPIVVFLPLISATGVYGAFFRALAITLSVALLTSLALALTWTPNLSQYFIHHRAAQPRTDEEFVNSNGPDEELKRLLAAEEASMTGFFGRIIGFYERWLRRALEHPKILLAGSVAFIVISIVCFLALESDLMPEMDEGGFIIDYVMPPGSSLQETDRVLSHITQMLKSTPEVESTSRRTGLQLGLAAVTEANTGDISVKLKAKRDRDVEEIISEVRAKIKQQEPAIDVEFVQLLQDMINDLSGAPEPVEVKLFSQDPTALRDNAPKVAEAIGNINIGKHKPVVDVLDGIENTMSGPAVSFNVNPTVAARAGFTPEEVVTDAEAILEGATAATPMVVNDRAYTIRVRFPQENRSSLESMSNTLLVSSAGRTATLGALANITELPGQTEVKRENLQREVSVTARLEGVSLSSGIAKVQKAVADLHLPSSIRIEYGGTYKEQQNSFHDLIIVLILALILVFTVLLFEFRTFSAPLAVLSSALLSTCGVFFALLITRTTFNVASFIGLIMVVGIVAKNGILLLDADQKFRTAGMPAEEAMLQAGRRRLRPIVMTALATVCGMLPLALALGAGSQMLQPMAIAVIGGILISMILSLIITPAIHYYLTRKDNQSVA